MEKIKRLLYGGQNRAFFTRHRSEIFSSNNDLLFRMCLLTASAMGVLTLVSFVAAHLAHLRLLYGGFFAAFLFLGALCHLKIPESAVSVHYLRGYAYYVLLFGFAYQLGVPQTPRANAVMYLVFLLAVPLIFTVPLHRIYIALLPIFLVFCSGTLHYKERGVAVLDITNGIACLVCGFVVSALMLRSRVEVLALEERLRCMSELDELTGIPNRRSFNNFLRAAYPLSPNLALVVADIDNFKMFNDTYGHLQGDDALKCVSAVLARASQEAGVYVARFGGEEFVIADTRHTPAQFTALMREIIDNVYAQNIKNEKSLTGRISLSCGLAFKPGTESCDELIRRADEALYKAKSSGKNQVVVADEGTSAEQAL